MGEVCVLPLSLERVELTGGALREPRVALALSDLVRLGRKWPRWVVARRD